MARVKRYKLDEEKRKEVIARYLEGESGPALGRGYGVCATTILNIVRDFDVSMVRKIGSCNMVLFKQLENCHAGEMYLCGMSIPEISRKTDITKSTVRLSLIRMGIKLRSRAEGVRNCKTLGLHSKGVKKNFSEAHRKSMSNAKLR